MMNDTLESYIRNARLRHAELERMLSAYDFAANGQAEFQKMNAEYQKLKQLVSAWDEEQRMIREKEENQQLLEEGGDPDLLAMAREEVESAAEKISQLDGRIKSLILPMHPNEGRNVILEIRPGAGGEEACLFAGDLYRMYSRYLEKRGWKAEVLDYETTELGGLKNLTLSISGDGAWSALRFESGVHRVQRVPETETQGRIHTSTATVAIMAEAAEVDFELKPEDLRIDVFRASGHGGQCVNRTDSAVRVTHLPTGMFVASQQEKSQHRNKEIAMTLLRSRLLAIKQREEDEKNAAARKIQVGTGDRSEKIRTYNFPQRRLTDHRFEITLYDLETVMAGNMDLLLDQIQAMDAEQRFQEMLLG